MFNGSAMDINSNSNPLGLGVCLKSIHAGIVVAYFAMSFCFILGTPAHAWLVCLSLRSGWKIKPTQVFSLNLNTLELIYSMQCSIEMLNLLIFKHFWLWRVIFFIISLNWVGIPLLQTCICVEQYLAVIHPVMFLKYKALQYRIVCAAVVWLIMAACAIYETFIDFFADYLLNSVIFFSVSVTSFCCVSVLHALKQPGPGDTQTPVERSRDAGSQQKRNAFNTIFAGLLVVLFSYLPQVLLSLIHLMPISQTLYYCNIAPIMTSFNTLGVMITPLPKMYKNVHMKVFKRSLQN